MVSRLLVAKATQFDETTTQTLHTDYEVLDGNSSNLTNASSTSGSDTIIEGMAYPYRLELDVTFQIGLYVGIFLLAVVGNCLVILTLVQNQGMRTITNLFLLNLAISDLLVGVLCMPFSLVGIILKDFVFGALLCKLIPYLQAVSVSVSAWTLVAISVERYYAICHPLTSRRWQTLSHAYKMIGVVWILSGLSMLPIAVVNTLQPIRDTGRHKCREEWPNWKLERAYTVFLDIILLVLPLVIMSVKYSLITRILWHVSGNNSGRFHEPSYTLAPSGGTEEELPTTPSASTSPSPKTVLAHTHSNGRSVNYENSFRWNSSTPNQLTPNASVAQTNSFRQKARNVVNLQRPTLLRRCNVVKSLRRKKRVIQMLGVVVAEFFVCWTPLYIMNTWYLFSPSAVYGMIGPLGVSLIHLIAYLSSCVNPITYGFMSKGFRMAFFHVFGCNSSERHPRYPSSPRGTEQSIRLVGRRTVYYNSSIKPGSDA